MSDHSPLRTQLSLLKGTIIYLLPGFSENLAQEDVHQTFIPSGKRVTVKAQTYIFFFFFLLLRLWSYLLLYEQGGEEGGRGSHAFFSGSLVSEHLVQVVSEHLVQVVMNPGPQMGCIWAPKQHHRDHEPSFTSMPRVLQRAPWILSQEHSASHAEWVSWKVVTDPG